MANPRQRRKNKSGLKVSRKIRKVNLRNVVINEPTIQAAWDSTKTVHENFQNIGLSNKLNADIGSAQLRRKVLAWSSEREKILEKVRETKNDSSARAEKEGVLDMTPLDLGEEAIFGQLNALFESTQSSSSKVSPVVQELESKAKISAALHTKKVKKLNEDELEYITALINKYGLTNTIAMARDIKLNFNQLTPKKLENMIEIYNNSSNKN